MEQTSDIRAVDTHPASLQLDAKFIERQIAVLLDALAHKIGVRGKLATAKPVTLPACRKRARRGLQLHEIVHKPRRNPEMT